MTIGTADPYRLEKVLITGSVGLLGSALVRHLKEKGFQTMEFAGDIADFKNVRSHENLIGQSDWIIHTAALTNVNICEKEREHCFRVNVEGTRHIRDLARTVGAKLIYISTVSVFSGEEGDYRESDPPYPKNYYNLSKYLGEQLVAEYEKGMTLRVNLIGIHPDGSRGLNFLEWLYDSIRQNKDMSLFTDVKANPLCNWTLTEKIVELIEKQVADKMLHLGSADVLSKAEIADLLLKRLPGYSGKASFVSVDEMSKGAFRPKEMWLNTDRAKEILGGLPNLEDEIEKIFNLSPIK